MTSKGYTCQRLGLLLLTLFSLTACGNARTRLEPTATPARPRFEVVAEGLLGPLGLAVLPDGSLLVAEAGTV